MSSEKEASKQSTTSAEDENLTDSELSETSDVETSDVEGSNEDETPGPSSTSSSKLKKKKRAKRCGACKKRLSVVNEYECRCGKWFCSTHRYAELHNCQFDYKEEGRRIIAEANPLIVAPKIQKI